MTDNTNADIETRAYWVKVAREFNVPIRLVCFTASSRLAEHNDAVRAMNPHTVCTLWNHVSSYHTIPQAGIEYVAI